MTPRELLKFQVDEVRSLMPPATIADLGRKQVTPILSKGTVAFRIVSVCRRMGLTPTWRVSLEAGRPDGPLKRIGFNALVKRIETET